jgi:uncharacterized membrane protein YidH (DUF202 family)
MIVILNWLFAGYLLRASFDKFETDTTLALFMVAVSVMNMVMGTIEYRRIRNAGRQTKRLN